LLFVNYFQSTFEVIYRYGGFEKLHFLPNKNQRDIDGYLGTVVEIVEMNYMLSLYILWQQHSRRFNRLFAVPFLLAFFVKSYSIAYF